MKPKQIPEVPVSEIPEVKTYLDSEEKLRQFREMYKGLFDELEELVLQRNTALEAAEQKVRGEKVKCGPFDLYQYTQKYDAQRFHDLVGRDQFLKLGGVLEMKPAYSIDKKAFEAHAAQGKIPQGVVEEVVKITPTYHVPSKIVLP